MDKVRFLKEKLRLLKAKYNWQTDKDGRKFIYIKPEEIQEYQRKGWTIERGPRGGVRAYPPKDYKFDDVDESVSNNKEEKVYITTDDVSKIGVDLIKNIYRLYGVYTWSYVLKNFDDEDVQNSLMMVIVKALYNDSVDSDSKQRIINVIGKENIENWVKENLVVTSQDKIKEIGLECFVEIDGECYVSKADVFEQSELIISALINKFYLKYILSSDDEYKEEFENHFSRLINIVNDILGNSDEFKERIEIHPEFRFLKLAERFAKNDRVVEFDFDEFKEKVWPKFEKILNDDYLMFSSIEEMAERSGYDTEWFDDEDDAGKIFATMYRVYMYLKNKIGLSDEDAFILAKGYDAMRFWTSGDFKRFSAYVEEIIKEIYGNHREMRNFYDDVYDKGVGVEFFENYADVNSVKSWINFNQSLLRAKFGNYITVYRGINYVQWLEIVLNKWKYGDVRYGGVLDSFSVSRSVASEFADTDTGVVKATIPVEWVVGSWLNASPNYSWKEKEIIVNKPEDGLRVEADLSYMWFVDGRWKEMYDDYDILESAVVEFAKNVVQGFADSVELYGEEFAELIKDDVVELLEEVSSMTDVDLSDKIAEIYYYLD